MRSSRIDSGKHLNESWEVYAKHALYHRDGIWYHVLLRFPGAYFDQNGYVLFSAEHDYRSHPDIRIGKQVWVRCGISKLAGYARMRDR